MQGRIGEKYGTKHLAGDIAIHRNTGIDNITKLRRSFKYHQSANATRGKILTAFANLIYHIGHPIFNRALLRVKNINVSQICTTDFLQHRTQFRLKHNDYSQKSILQKIAYNIVERRPGDIAECYADPSKAKNVLGWEAEYGIETMCEDLARWQTNNPNGYGE